MWLRASRLEHQLKVLIARNLCRPVVGQTIGHLLKNRIRSGPVTIDTSHPAIAASVKAALFWGFYESAEVQFVRDCLRLDLDVVELGSSIGVVSSHIAQMLPPSRRLLCVEANPALIDAIETNVAINAPRATPRIINAAVTARPGHAELAVSTVNVFSRLGSGAGSLRVPALSLSDILRNEEIGRFALVSDIEGSEVEFISDPARPLATCDQLIIEVHDVTVEGRRLLSSDVLQMICEQGFTVAAQRGNVFALDRHAPTAR